MTSIGSRRLFIPLYAASGAAALLYEVTWMRLLTLQMGHTVAAASTVLAAFMGGLAAGAWIAGQFGTRTPSNRLRIYAALELGIGLFAIALPWAMAACLPLLRWAYADGSSPFTFGTVRLVISLALLGLPASAMGATFPLAAAWLAREDAGREIASDAGALYAANTGGAAFGALAAGFWLIPLAGLGGTTLIGVLLNAFAAAGALWLAAQPGRDAGTDAADSARASSPAPRTARTPSASRKPRSIASSALAAPCTAAVWTAATLSGFAALVYEVAWTRLIALVIGPTTYAFATMAASFVAGLAVGSAAGTWAARRAARPALWLAALLGATALTASAAAWFAASRLPLIVAAQVGGADAAFGPIVLRQAAICALLLLPMTCALGAIFPLAIAGASPSRPTIARDTASVYAFNTVGAVVGALAGGFLLLPRTGLQNTFRISALIGIAGGIAVWWMAALSRGRRIAGALAGVGAATLIVAGPSWDRDLLSSGAYKYAPYMRAGDLETTMRAGRLEYYKDGSASTVSVRRLAGTLSLAIDGKIDASNAGDMLTQRLLGLLPVLLHRQVRDICIIGLGSGVTVGSALAAARIRHADVVEISPEVVEASALFVAENGRALSSAPVRLIVGDGRSHLMLTAERYDVIVSEPSNPWMAGVAALFTREFFESVRARLNDDGVFCQWAHTYDISSGNLRSIVRTFASVFPQSTMWLVGGGDLLLIGTTGAAIEPRLNAIVDAPFPSPAQAALADMGVPAASAPFALLSLYAGGPDEVARFGDSAIIQRDDRMALEFSAPRAIYGRTQEDNAQQVRDAAGRDRRGSRPAVVEAAYRLATAGDWAARGAMNLRAEAFGTAYDDLRRSVEMDPADVNALRHLSEAAGGAGRQGEERAFLETLARAHPRNAPVRIELSRALAASGHLDDAVTAAEEAMRIAPDDPRPGEQLASVFADAGDGARLGPLADALITRFPDREDGHFYRATALFLNGRPAEAATEARRVISANPRHARAQNLLGAACAVTGQRECASAAFDAALETNPRDPSTYVNIGVFHMESGDPAGAAEYFAEALTIDPTSVAARQGLSQSHAALAKP